jgi:hypothetical protein
MLGAAPAGWRSELDLADIGGETGVAALSCGRQPAGHGDWSVLFGTAGQVLPPYLTDINIAVK